MRYTIIKDRKTCEVCKKSFSNASALRGHMMSHTKRRSAPKAEGAQQRKDKGKMIVDEADSTRSHSSLTVVEEAALCLVAMSKGERPKNSENWSAIDRFLATPKGKEKHTEEYYETGSDDDDDDDDDDEAYVLEREKKCKKEFICDDCGKVYSSYQALGGHRAGQKCKRLKICDRGYMCDVCGRVFESRQALGGHKKIHYI